MQANVTFMQEIVIDLPMPPSVNRIWRVNPRTKKPYRNPAYLRWIKEAGGLYMAQRAGKGWRMIEGAYEMTITLDRTKTKGGDIDNRIKAIADFAQKAGIIANDKNCIRLSIAWGEADLGARICFTAV